MSESTALLLAVTVGLPCALLALAVIHHARVIGRMPAADEGWDPDEADELPTFSLPPMTMPAAPDPAMVDLQRAMSELQGQLARQRETLTALLSDQQRAAAVRTAAPVPARAPAAPLHLNAEPPVETADLGIAVRNLSAEGLSERAIARRLHVGLEEVRLLSRRRELAS